MLNVQRLDDVKRRGPDVTTTVDEFRRLDASRKELVSTLDEMRNRRNDASKKMAKVADKNSTEFAQARDELRELSNAIKSRESEQHTLEDDVRSLHLQIPNAPHDSVPFGSDEDANQLLHEWGNKPGFAFTPKNHWDIGEDLGILDFETAAKTSGARFCILRDAGSRLNRALLNFMIDVHTERGYREVWPPALVRADNLEGTGQLPKFEADLFHVREGEFYLSPTAEVQITNMHRDDILEPSQMPVAYCGYSPCFRAEAGSYGKDTRGLIRQHQFDKIELVRFVEPERSYEMLEQLRTDAEEILKRLELHYRVVTLCTGDLGFSAAKTFDIEVWLPGAGKYREISSCSNFEDFQARRAMIRYRPAAGDKPRYVHTINGSGIAIGRTIVAILEQYQREDGSVAIPAALQPYCGGMTEITGT